jgi:hypothetical protein
VTEWVKPGVGIEAQMYGHEDNLGRKRVKATEELSRNEAFDPAAAAMQPHHSQ